MALDENLLELKRRVDEARDDPNAWRPYLSALARAGTTPEQYLDSMFAPVIAATKTILLARAGLIQNFPPAVFHDEQRRAVERPALYIGAVPTQYTDRWFDLYFLPTEGLACFRKIGEYEGVSLLNSRDEIVPDYLRHGAHALEAIERHLKAEAHERAAGSNG